MRLCLEMTIKELLQLAFQNVGAHLTNLESIRNIVDDLLDQAQSFEDTIMLLEMCGEEGAITLKTDIRILINELWHLSRKRSAA